MSLPSLLSQITSIQFAVQGCVTADCFYSTFRYQLGIENMGQQFPLSSVAQTLSNSPLTIRKMTLSRCELSTVIWKALFKAFKQSIKDLYLDYVNSVDGGWPSIL